MVHIWHFAGATAKIWLSWNSATPISIIRDFLIVLVGAALMTRVQFRKWIPTREDLQSGRGKEIVISLCVGILALAFVLGVLFVAAIPVVVWQDHKALVEQNQALVEQNNKLLQELATKAPTYPIPSRTNVLLPDNKPNPMIHVDPSAAFDAMTNSLRQTGIDPSKLGITTEMSDAFLKRALSHIPHGALRVYLGSSLGYVVGASQVVLNIAGQDVLTVNRTPEGLDINAQVFGEDDRILYEIEHNVLHPNQRHPDYWRAERPDKHRLEVH